MATGGITPVASLVIVGPDNIEGDERAGQYYILNISTMKQVVGSSEEIVDDYKEYLGEITWSISGNGASVISTTGTEAHVSLSGSDTIVVSATVNGITLTKNVTTNYYITDYYISSFSDLQELQRVINNSSESTISLAKNPDSQYTPVNSGGLSGAHLRLTNDIDCGGSNVHIGYIYNVSLNTDIPTSFRGIFDGAGYKIHNLGGQIYSHSTSSSSARYSGCLFECAYQAKIFNFTITGSYTKCNYYNAVLAFTRSCTINRIRSSITTDRTTANSSGQRVGFSMSGGWNTMSDILTKDNLYGARVGGIEFWPSYGTFTRLIDLDELHNIGTNMSVATGTICAYSNSVVDGVMNITSIESRKYDNGDLNNATALGMLNETNATTFKNAYSVRRSCIARTVGWCIRMGSYRPTIQNVYYDLAKCGFDRQTDEGATSKTTIELKSGTLYPNDPNWIVVSGFYPLINNQYAVDPDVLAAIRI